MLISPYKARNVPFNNRIAKTNKQTKHLRYLPIEKGQWKVEKRKEHKIMQEFRNDKTIIWAGISIFFVEWAKKKAKLLINRTIISSFQFIISNYFYYLWKLFQRIISSFQYYYFPKYINSAHLPSLYLSLSSHMMKNKKMNFFFNLWLHSCLHEVPNCYCWRAECCFT